MQSPWWCWVLALLPLVATGVVLFVRWRRARAWLSAMARNLGIERKPLETDEELRARCKAVLSPTSGPTKAGLTEVAEKAARRYGYTADVTIDRERGLVSVGVRGCPCAEDLASIERDIEDHLPMTIALEVSATTP